MKKFKIFLAAGLALAMASCTENFDTATAPQSNAQEETFEQSDVTVTPVSVDPVAYDEYTDSSTLIPVAVVKVADGKMPANSIVKASVQMSLDEDYAKSTTIDAESMESTDTIKVMLCKLQEAYKDNLTPSIKQKTIYMRSALEIVTNETSIAEVGTPGETYFPVSNLVYTPQYYEQTPVYYIYGSTNNYDQYSAAFYPESSTKVSYTGYFKGGNNDLIIRTQEQADGKLTSAWGAETNKDATCTNLIPETKNYLKCPGTGVYTLNVDFDENTYSWTKVDDEGLYTANDTISLSGDFNSWGDTDMKMVKVQGSSSTKPIASHNWAYVGLNITTETSGLKFRLNHAWDTSWGIPGTAKLKVDKSTYGVSTSESGQDFTLSKGTWNIYFNDITKQFYFIKIE